MVKRSVVGWDLGTLRVVRVDDAAPQALRDKGYHGDRTLVCLHCHVGVDGSPGTDVPLVYAGGRTGKVRPHLRHPPGLGPCGGHDPATGWSVTATATLAATLRTVAGVEVHDRREGGPISVRCADGRRLVIEIHQRQVPPDEWRARRADYAAAGIIDVWLWHHRAGAPRPAAGEPQCDWLLAEDPRWIGTPVADGHPPTLWANDTAVATVEVAHHPPCPGDRVRYRWVAIEEYPLGRQGFGLPDRIVVELATAAAASLPSMPAGINARARIPVPRRSRRRGLAQPPPSVHIVHRVDALPPGADPDLRRYRCQDGCGYLGSAALTDGVHLLLGTIETIAHHPQ